jgi:hypothetical protein
MEETRSKLAKNIMNIRFFALVIVISKISNQTRAVIEEEEICIFN